MKVMFLDESGDHNMTRIDPRYPVFVLGGVIMDADYSAGPLREEVDDFKREVFERTDITLHTADIARNRNGFEPLQDAVFRVRFYNRLNSMMRNLEYSVVACSIRKEAFRALHGVFAPDLYLHAFSILAEVFSSDLDKTGSSGIIISEGRDSVLNRRLEAEWFALKSSSAAEAKMERVNSLTILGKNDNVAGLEIADLVVSPVGRKVIGRADHDDWRIVEEKLLRNDAGEYLGYGLIVLP